MDQRNILRGNSVRSWCSGSSDRSFMGWIKIIIGHSFVVTHLCLLVFSAVQRYRVVGSILCGGPIELYLHNRCNKLHGICCRAGWVDKKDPLILIIAHNVSAASFFSCYLNGILLYVRRHITVNEIC